MISKKLLALSFVLCATTLLLGMEIKNTQPSIALGKKAAEKALNEGDLVTAENLIKQLEDLQQRTVAAPLRERLERAKKGGQIVRGNGLQGEMEQNLKATLDQLTQCQKERNDTVSRLQAAVDQLHKELDNCEKKLEKCEDAQDRVKTQEAAINNLKTIIQKRDDELKKCNDELNRSTAELRKAQEDLRNAFLMPEKYKTQMAKDAAARKACEDELAKLRKELEDTKNQLALAKTSPAPDTGDCADRIKVLTQQLEAARASEAKAVSSASDARKESQNALQRVEAAEEMRNQIKRTLEAEIKKLQQENAKIKDCEAKIATIKAAINVAIEIIKADPAKGIQTLTNAQQNL